jgi:hypothetical protein
VKTPDKNRDRHLSYAELWCGGMARKNPANVQQKSSGHLDV